MQGQHKYNFARDRFLGIKTLQQIGNLKRQLLEALAQAGLAPGLPRTREPSCRCLLRMLAHRTRSVH